MTLQLRNPLFLIGVAFVLAVAVFTAVNRGGDVQLSSGDGGAAEVPRTTDERIAALEASVRLAPQDADQRVLLADAYVQKVREGGDASALNAKAEAVLEQARRIEPRNSAVYTGLGTIQLARHDFSGGLAYGLKARRLAPDTVKPLGVIVDGQVELGRYGDAARTLQTMLDEKPSAAAYARASYFRELNGDLSGARAAMRLAVSAGGDAPENVAYHRSLLGDLELGRGDLDAATSAYRLALDSVPGHTAAAVGLARVDAARGNLDGAVERLRAVAGEGASPETLTVLGEAELAAGRTQAGEAHLAQARAEERARAAGGENTDTELALLEAEHGSPALGVRLGRSGWRNAPNVRSANALGWALTRAGRPRAGLRWARRALRLGSRDPMFLYHAGIAAKRSGETALARRWLTASLALNPRFSPLHAPRAKRALRQLGAR
jgi:tetratricopeptide (TPR) repeat protein